MLAGKTAPEANDYCKSHDGKLYLIESVHEKESFFKWLTLESNNYWGTVVGKGWFVNGYESSLNRGQWLSDTNKSLIPEVVPPSTPANEKCMFAVGDSGKYEIKRKSCDATPAFVCQL